MIGAIHTYYTYSFARWWEGRMVWGAIVNIARNYTRLVLASTPDDKR